MLCAISGEAPEVPVASRKSGNVFERRLIESYISEHGTDPITGEVLTVEDLIDLRSARVVKPRPPTLTSIPSLLSVFQQEWDALALESYQLKQSISKLRVELSSALYNNDAAIRVIARLTKERDEARDALGKMSITERRTTTNGGGDAMQVDGTTLPESMVAKVDATREHLSKTRRKRPIPEEWALPEDIQQYSQTTSVQMVKSGTSLATNAQQDMVVVGGSDGTCCMSLLSDLGAAQSVFVGDGAVTDVAFWQAAGRSLPIVATATGAIKIFDGAEEHGSLSRHAGAVSGLSLHPCGSILASVSEDKSFVFYDLESMTVASQTYTNSKLTCCHFHPDGHLLAAGAIDGEIKLFDVNSGESAATFDAGGPVQSLSFSENGIWLAVVVQASTSVSIWDLRKAAVVKVLEFGSVIRSIDWDYTGQYLAAVGSNCLVVQHYDKASKGWSEPLRKATSGRTVRWGAQAKSLLVASTEGSLELLQ